MPGSTGSRPAKDQSLAKRARAVELRAQRLTYDQIAATEWDHGGARGVGRLYANKQNARAAVLQALKDHEAEQVSDLRTIHGMTLEQLIRVAMGAALQGSWDAMREARMLLADYAKLWGLNAPTQVDIGGEVDREIQALVAALSPDGESWDITGVPDEPAPEVES